MHQQMYFHACSEVVLKYFVTCMLCTVFRLHVFLATYWLVAGPPQGPDMRRLLTSVRCPSVRPGHISKTKQDRPIVISHHGTVLGSWHI